MTVIPEVLSSQPFFPLLLAFIDILLALAAVISNAAFLVTVHQDPHRNLWTPVTFLVVNLSVCDMLAGSVTGFGSAGYNLAIFTGSTTARKISGLATVSFAVITSIVGSFTLVVMSFDRWFSIASPLRYRASLTTTKVKVLIALFWAYAFLFAALSPTGVPLDILTLLYCHLHVSVPILVLAVIYRQTYRALRSHSDHLHTLSHGNERMTTIHRNRERKVTSAFLFVLIVFYSVFFPQFLALNILVLCLPCAASRSFQTFFSLSVHVPLLNNSVNPFIYAWRIPKYRKAFQTVLQRCFRRPQRRSVVVPVSRAAAGGGNPAVLQVRTAVGGEWQY